MKMYEVLKTFPLSRDGISKETLSVGAVVGDVPESMVPGLVAEGWLKELPAKAAAPAGGGPEGGDDDKGGGKGGAGGADTLVPIPEAFKDLPWAELMELAGKFTADPIKSKAEAIATIEAELTKRQNPQG
jgi:hypothetical protein